MRRSDWVGQRIENNFTNRLTGNHRLGLRPLPDVEIHSTPGTTSQRIEPRAANALHILPTDPRKERRRRNRNRRDDLAITRSAEKLGKGAYTLDGG